MIDAFPRPTQARQVLRSLRLLDGAAGGNGNSVLVRVPGPHDDDTFIERRAKTHCLLFVYHGMCSKCATNLESAGPPCLQCPEIDNLALLCKVHYACVGRCPLDVVL